jgi:hypothetical protein
VARDPEAVDDRLHELEHALESTGRRGEYLLSDPQPGPSVAARRAVAATTSPRLSSM